MRVDLVHLWDNETKYRTDLPEVVEYKDASPGVLSRWRIFRNTGFCTIPFSKELHFPSIPYLENGKESNILVLHYGNLNKVDRVRKYMFYESQDVNFKDGDSYKYLLDEHVTYARVNELVSVIKHHIF